MDPVFIGVSLKMYLDHAATLRWVADVVEIAERAPAIIGARIELAVLPTFVSIEAVAALTSGSPVVCGAQDLAWADAGPFTGEVSGRDLAELGCRYVEVGHAERRRLLGEDDKIISAKYAAAVRNRLIPILCVGEAERGDPAAAARVCAGQLRAALLGVEDPGAELIIAYEPVWAIGADHPASVDHVRTVCQGVRTAAVDAADSAPGHKQRLSRVRVIYGGSAGPGLLAELGREAVDGLFLGRSAHDPAALARVLDEAAQL